MLKQTKNPDLQSEINILSQLIVNCNDDGDQIALKAYQILITDKFIKGDLKTRKSFLIKELKASNNKFSTISYPRRQIEKAVLEIHLGLEACTLKEFHARCLFEVKGLSGQRKVYLMAEKMAKQEGIKLTSVLINKAIEKYNQAKNENEQSEPEQVDEVKVESTEQPTSKNAKSPNRFKSTEMNADAEENDDFDEIDPPSFNECRTDEIYHEIKSQFKSEMDSRTFTLICNGSESLWKVIKILARYDKSQIDIPRLLNMVGEKSKTKKRRRTGPSRGKKRLLKKPPIKKLITD
jgi:hypothetical protein